MANATLIISVYNRVHELELILVALGNQSYTDFEVIIADDGSGKEMHDFIDAYKQQNKLKIKHVYQEDSGFRKNKILNSAIKNSSTDYLIFIDGDCIPHSDFIKEHCINRQENTVLCGRRVNLGKKLSDEITKEKIISKEFQKIGLKHFKDSLQKKKTGSNYIEEGLIFKSGILTKIFLSKTPHLLGCNFSIEKKLMKKINGFDENYIGPGIGEDSDIEYRLRLAGAGFKSLRNKAVLFHLYHEINKISKDNMAYFEEVQKLGEYKCKNGLIKL